jgi:hypothetical protein
MSSILNLSWNFSLNSSEIWNNYGEFEYKIKLEFEFEFKL